MAEYKRFVSYIYEYNRGRRAKNAGFAKVESRNGICKIQLHLQNMSAECGELQIHAFVREGEWLKGILLGKAFPQLPVTEIKITTPSEHVGNMDYDLNHISGLWINCAHGDTYLSVWDDEPVEIEKLVVKLPEEEEKEPEVQEEMQEEEKERESQEEMQEEEKERESQEEMQEEEKEPESQEEMQEEEKEPESVEEMQAEEEKAESRAEAPKQKIRAQETAACRALKNPGQACRNCPPSLDQRWQCLSGRYSHVQPFEGNEVADCIRIAPRDLGILRQNQWQLGRNSFLMHGYYNYRHLLFGKCADGKYFLGIPGIKESQEEFMASMFGFPQFRRGAEQKGNGVFGYWCRPIE